MMKHKRIGADTLLKYLAKGTDTDIASMVPIRAVAISRPIASASSLPLNHFTIIFETVIPAISTPTPNMAYPKAAMATCAFIPRIIRPSMAK
jgi:hypothetical protein